MQALNHARCNTEQENVQDFAIRITPDPSERRTSSHKHIQQFE